MKQNNTQNLFKLTSLVHFIVSYKPKRNWSS